MHKYLGARNFHEIVEQHCELGWVLDNCAADLDDGSAVSNLSPNGERNSGLLYLIIISFHWLLEYM